MVSTRASPRISNCIVNNFLILCLGTCSNGGYRSEMKLESFAMKIYRSNWTQIKERFNVNTKPLLKAEKERNQNPYNVHVVDQYQDQGGRQVVPFNFKLIVLWTTVLRKKK